MSEKLIEQIDFTGADFSESPDGPKIVRNVVMLGPVSSHGYEYTEQAMKRAVDGGLYEGCRCFIDHASGNRSVMDLAGQFRNVRFETGKIKGDAHLLDDDKGRKFWTIAKTAPAAAGCSHVAEGRLVRGADGKQRVEEIVKVHSVDLVVQGATTKNVFEAETVEGDIPRPGPRERQIDFVPRCVALLQAANTTITTEQAMAVCFTAWQARYEPGGQTDEDPLPTATPAANEKNTTSGHEPQKESSTMNTENTPSALDQIEEHLDSVERIARLGLPGVQEITRKESLAARDAEYERRCEQRKQDARTLAEITSRIPDPMAFREDDDAFASRCRERRTLREQNAREAVRIAEEAAGGANLIEVE